MLRIRTESRQLAAMRAQAMRRAQSHDAFRHIDSDLIPAAIAGAASLIAAVLLLAACLPG